MSLDQKVQRDYEPIEPKSEIPPWTNYLVRKGIKLGVLLNIATGLIVTPYLVEGYTPQEIEAEISTSTGITRTFLDLGRPGREIAYYLHEK